MPERYVLLLGLREVESCVTIVSRLAVLCVESSLFCDIQFGACSIYSMHVF